MFYTPFLFTSLSNRINAYQYLLLAISALWLSGANTGGSLVNATYAGVTIAAAPIQVRPIEKLGKAFQS